MSRTAELLEMEFETRMEQECELLAELHDRQVVLKEKIRTKDWNGLEQTMKTISELADTLVEVDEARQGFFDELRAKVLPDAGANGDSSFYGVVVRLPDEMRERLSELYRKMKFSVLGIQTVTWCIDEHVQTINDTMHQILGELYPHKKGNIYSSAGIKRQSESNPLLVDTRL